MDIGRITSRQNRLVREAAALAADGEKRREKGLFLCEGARLCQDAARSGVGVEVATGAGVTTASSSTSGTSSAVWADPATICSP